ncbi:sensor histidine kinase [Prosthecomicrobium sp. N25]|uniref:sensor histidine kinase n=1 Tax=Prosthecomicrobium sp. N25 TaxID=3129254 RepID=UPI003076AF72
MRPTGNLSAPPGSRTGLGSLVRSRVDRIIALARIVLAVGSIYICWLDQTHPTDFTDKAFVILAVYLAYAVVVAVRAHMVASASRSGALLRHAIDLATFLVLVAGEGSSSPFFMFVPFTLLAATLHWRAKGSIWTGGICLTILLVTAIFDQARVLDLDIQATRDASRVVFTLVASTLLIWIGAQQDRTSRELIRVSDRIPRLQAYDRWPTAQALGYAAHVLDVDRLVFVFSERDEPWIHIADWTRGEHRYRCVEPDAYEGLVDEALAGRSFTFGPRGARLISRDGRAVKPFDGPAINPRFGADYAIGSALALAIGGEDVEGHLFLVGLEEAPFDRSVIGDIVVSRIEAVFAEFNLIRKLRRKAEESARLRVSRDVHDGVLQTLTSCALQIDDILRTLKSDPERSEVRLRRMLDLIRVEQKDIRATLQIGATAPGGPPEDQDRIGLADFVAPTLEKLRRRWSLALDLVVDPADLRVPPRLGTEISYLISEAAGNAARHAGARKVWIAVDGGPQAIAIRVRNVIADPAAAPASWVPGTIRDRVATLGGTMIVEKADRETSIALEIPFNTDQLRVSDPG